MSINTWREFLAYAKVTPIIPKDMAARAKLYHDMQDKCKCGVKDPICKFMKVKPIKTTSPYDASKDPMLLKAKIKAYKDIVASKDQEIDQLVKTIDRLERRLKKKHASA